MRRSSSSSSIVLSSFPCALAPSLCCDIDKTLPYFGAPVLACTRSVLSTLPGLHYHIIILFFLVDSIIWRASTLSLTPCHPVGPHHALTQRIQAHHTGVRL
ncbi:hypothetical protein C8R45DRAFT_1032901, partial [Mycena sanguinolenta]